MPISRFVSEMVENEEVRISAKADYAVRAAVELAAVDGPVKGEHISQSQHIPLKFLEDILIEPVVEHVTVADVAAGSLPKRIEKLAQDPDAWVTR